MKQWYSIIKVSPYNKGCDFISYLMDLFFVCLLKAGDNCVIFFLYPIYSKNLNI